MHKEKIKPQILSLILRYRDVQSSLFVCFYLSVCSELALYSQHNVRGFQNALVYVVCLPIWQEATENKSKD
jgi:hypothetical protein